jgi:hypothetical protein
MCVLYTYIHEYIIQHEYFTRFIGDFHEYCIHTYIHTYMNTSQDSLRTFTNTAYIHTYMHTSHRMDTLQDSLRGLEDFHDQCIHIYIHTYTHTHHAG